MFRAALETLEILFEVSKRAEVKSKSLNETLFTKCLSKMETKDNVKANTTKLQHLLELRTRIKIMCVKVQTKAVSSSYVRIGPIESESLTVVFSLI